MQHLQTEGGNTRVVPYTTNGCKKSFSLRLTRTQKNSKSYLYKPPCPQIPKIHEPIWWTPVSRSNHLWLIQWPFRNLLVPSVPSDEPAETGPMWTKPDALTEHQVKNKEARWRQRAGSQGRRRAVRHKCINHLFSSPPPPMSWQREFWRGSVETPEPCLTCDRWGSVGGRSFWLRVSLSFFFFPWLLSLIHWVNQRRLVATGPGAGSSE